MHTMFSTLKRTPALERTGFRFGAKGTHSSRTMMLRELSDLLAATPADASREDYAAAIVEENALGKQTWATRRRSCQHLRQLYGLDPALPLFRVLRRLWADDPPGRPLAALLCALARDPLLRSSATHIVALNAGETLARDPFSATLRGAVGQRLNNSSLDTVARNAGSSWTQTGHLEGRLRKIRRRIEPTPGAAALALWLGELQGLAGLSLLASDWAAALDHRGSPLLPFAQDASRCGLIRARAAGTVVEIDARSLDPAVRR